MHPVSTGSSECICTRCLVKLDAPDKDHALKRLISLWVLCCAFVRSLQPQLPGGAESFLPRYLKSLPASSTVENTAESHIVTKWQLFLDTFSYSASSYHPQWLSTIRWTSARRLRALSSLIQKMECPTARDFSVLTPLRGCSASSTRRFRCSSVLSRNSSFISLVAAWWNPKDGLKTVFASFRFPYSVRGNAVGMSGC
jgi:hypothetical protein